MTREQKYVQQLRVLGVYSDAFEPEIHTLAEMERDLQRVRKAWKENGSDPTGDLFPAMERLRRDILTHREALGLTPRGLRRLRAKGFDDKDEEETSAKPTVLAMIAEKYA